MLLKSGNGIEVEEYYLTMGNREMLGYLIVDDHDCHSYYTVQNISKKPICERVSPVFAEYNDTFITDQERWYKSPILLKGIRKEKELQHEYYRDEFIERLDTCKYCVWFLGCDDGDKFMRFESKETALEFFSHIDFFDEIYDHPHCQTW